MVAARSGGFGGEVEWASDRWRPDRLSRSVSSLGLWVTRLMVRSKGSSDCEGVVGCRSVTCSWRFDHGWSVEKRENEGGREEGWWTQLAWRDGGQSLHGGWWTDLAQRTKLAWRSDSSGALSLFLSSGYKCSEWGWKSI